MSEGEPTARREKAGGSAKDHLLKGWWWKGPAAAALTWGIIKANDGIDSLSRAQPEPDEQAEPADIVTDRSPADSTEETPPAPEEDRSEVIGGNDVHTVAVLESGYPETIPTGARVELMYVVLMPNSIQDTSVPSINVIEGDRVSFSRSQLPQHMIQHLENDSTHASGFRVLPNSTYALDITDLQGRTLQFFDNEDTTARGIIAVFGVVRATNGDILSATLPQYSEPGTRGATAEQRRNDPTFAPFSLQEWHNF